MSATLDSFGSALEREGVEMYGGLMFVRWALVEKDRDPRPESEEWWRRRAARRNREIRERPSRSEPISAQELRERLEALGWG